MISHIQANEYMDLYLCLLSPRQQEVLELYFQDDLSLSEIQENLGISKAAVHDALRKGLDAMDQFERKLHLHSKQERIILFARKHPEIEQELLALL